MSAAPSRPAESFRVVQLFPTCLVNDLFPETGIAVVELLERAGVTVEMPRGLTCCGQPAFNAGFRNEAKAVARRTIELLARTTGPIVIPSGSCGDMLVHQCLELFRDEPAFLPKVRVVAERCREFTQFVAESLGGVLPSSSSSATTTTRLKVAYHPSCHLARGLRVTEAPIHLLASRPDLELVPVAEQDECCGFGGMFSVKQPEISAAMLDRKCRALEAAGADVVASCDSGCLLHLGGGLRRRGVSMRACHVAELLNAPPNSPSPAGPPT